MPAELLDAISIIGTPTEVVAKLDQWAESGVDEPILGMPSGSVDEVGATLSALMDALKASACRVLRRRWRAAGVCRWMDGRERGTRRWAMARCRPDSGRPNGSSRFEKQQPLRRFQGVFIGLILDSAAQAIAQGHDEQAKEG